MRISIKKKNKAFTLIEVLVSIAIFSIMIIPVSMMVISGVKNSKVGEYKQKATVISQQIIEELKANNRVSDGNKIDFRGGSIEGVAATTGHDISFSKEDINVDSLNGLTADVAFERRDLEYKNRSAESGVVYDLTIEMGNTDINIINGDGIRISTPIVSDSEFEIINNVDDGDKDNIELVWRNVSDFTHIGSYKRKIAALGKINSGKIKIVSGDNSANIRLDNKLTNALQIYVFKGTASKQNTFTYLNGLVQLYEDNLAEPTVADINNNGVYDISVKIYRNKNKSNEIKVYEASTAVSLVR